MVKEIRPITFVRDLRNEFNKRFDVEVEQAEEEAARQRSRAKHPSYREHDVEGEALDPPDEPAGPIDDAVGDVDAAPAARRRTAARD